MSIHRSGELRHSHCFHRNGCTARRKSSFGGRRVFEFPVSKTASLILSNGLAVRKQPARYRAKLYLLTTIRRLLRAKIAWPENWGIINADCKFAFTEKSLSTFRQKTDRLGWVLQLPRRGRTGPCLDNRIVSICSGLQVMLDPAGLFAIGSR